MSTRQHIERNKSGFPTSLQSVVPIIIRPPPGYNWRLPRISLAISSPDPIHSKTPKRIWEIKGTTGVLCGEGKSTWLVSSGDDVNHAAVARGQRRHSDSSTGKMTKKLHGFVWPDRCRRHQTRKLSKSSPLRSHPFTKINATFFPAWRPKWGGSYSILAVKWRREGGREGRGGDNLTELFRVPLSMTTAATSAFLTESATIERGKNPKMERGEFQSGG